MELELRWREGEKGDWDQTLERKTPSDVLTSFSPLVSQACVQHFKRYCRFSYWHVGPKAWYIADIAVPQGPWCRAASGRQTFTYEADVAGKKVRRAQGRKSTFVFCCYLFPSVAWNNIPLDNSAFSLFILVIRSIEPKKKKKITIFFFLNCHWEHCFKTADKMKIKMSCE